MEHTKILQTRAYVLCALFAALIAVGALIKIPVPVVPFTLQFLFTNLAGILLGKKFGMIAVGLYVTVGLIGFPVFAGGGGISYVLHPTFGYLIGFILGAWIAGYITERSEKPTYRTWLFAGLMNLLMIYTCGMIYYYCIANFYLDSPVGIVALIWFAFVLAIPGDILLCIITVFLTKRLLPITQKRGTDK